MGVRSLFTENTLLSVEKGTNYFVIDADTRSITPPTSFKNFGVESDENSNRVYFEAPRVVGDNLDLTTLNIRINYQNAKGEKDQYIVDDITVDGDVIHFSWLLSRKATQYSGAIMFIVCAVKTDSDGNIINEWNTTLATGTVLGGLEVDAPDIPENVTDVVSQLLDIVNNSIENVQNTASKAVENVQEAESKAIENISDILDDTLSMSGKAADSKAVGDELHTKANNIIVSASGSSIVVTDSAESTLKGLKLYGKTTQDGTPTPDIPVELVSVESPEVSVCGKNLIPETTVEFEKHYYIPLGMKYPAGVYCFSAIIESTDTDAEKSYVMFYMGETELVKSFLVDRSLDGEHVSFKVTVPDSFDRIRFYASTGWSESDGDVAKFTDIMFERGNTVSEYEAYNGGILKTIHTLHGIPVESGGNYTDTDGQQYICDEIDLERGVYIQRLLLISDFTLIQTLEAVLHYRHSDTVNILIGGDKAPTICNVTDTYVVSPSSNSVHFYINSSGSATNVYLPIGYDIVANPIKVLAVIATPIETPLTEDELIAYKSLLTNCPTTTLLNSQNAYMELKYAADINNYINQRYVPLSSYLALEERVKALEEV